MILGPDRSAVIWIPTESLDVARTFEGSRILFSCAKQVHPNIDTVIIMDDPIGSVISDGVGTLSSIRIAK